MRPTSASSWIVLVLALGAMTACGRGDKGDRALAAYRPSDACLRFQSADDCATAQCDWVEVEPGREDGSASVGGICIDPDPCRAHEDPESCTEDAEGNCTWMESDRVCPVGTDCNDGFCYERRPDDECSCVCPLGPCTEDGQCPPCACDCPPADGGGECPWVCPDCAPGSDACPPCYQDCGGTCTWVCPECRPDQPCPPCYQDCTEPPPSCDGGSPPKPCTCTCPLFPCTGDGVCPPCDCSCPDEQPVKPPTCMCPLGPCTEDGVCPPCDCPNPPPDDGNDPGMCVCECPDCQPGETCPPCSCDCPPPSCEPGEPQPSLPPDRSSGWQGGARREPAAGGVTLRYRIG